jgi:hypothetical protein
MMRSLQANSLEEPFANFAPLLPRQQRCCTIWPDGLMYVHYLVALPISNVDKGFILVFVSTAIRVEPLIAD